MEIQLKNHGRITVEGGIGNLKLDTPILMLKSFLFQNGIQFQTKMTGAFFKVKYSWKNGVISFITYIPTGRIVEISANQDFNGTYLDGLKFGVKIGDLLKKYDKIDIYPKNRLMSPEFKGFFIQLPKPNFSPEYFDLEEVKDFTVGEVGIFSRFVDKNDLYLEYGPDSYERPKFIPEWVQ